MAERLATVPPRVYPRACGGTGAELPGVGRPLRGHLSGRSIPAPAGEPLAPTDRPSDDLRTRSIPAPAGEPQVGSISSCASSGSIPAPAGEPPARRRRRLHGRGLSPRLRGNRADSPLRTGPAVGSIPAPAGEPHGAPMTSPPGSIPAPAGEPYPHPSGSTGVVASSGVYPRACGGTA